MVGCYLFICSLFCALFCHHYTHAHAHPATLPINRYIRHWSALLTYIFASSLFNWEPYGIWQQSNYRERSWTVWKGSGSEWMSRSVRASGPLSKLYVCAYYRITTIFLYRAIFLCTVHYVWVLYDKKAPPFWEHMHYMIAPIKYLTRICRGPHVIKICKRNRVRCVCRLCKAVIILRTRFL